MPNVRRAGRIILRVNGELIDAKGSWEYNLGGVAREFIVGADRVHGTMETIQLATLSGTITDRSDLDVQAMRDIVDTTIELVLGSGKSVIFRNAAATGEWTQTTEEAEIDASFAALSAEEIFA